MSYANICASQLNTSLECMAFLYKLMGAVDGQLSMSEAREAMKVLGEWRGVSDSDITTALSTVNSVMIAAGGNPNNVNTAVTHCCDFINTNMSAKARSSVLKDLARLAKADGRITNEEAQFWALMQSRLS